MTRTIGALDKKKRKVRKDRKRKYVHRKGKLVPYKTKRQRGDPIKIYFWKIEEMSKDGFENWSNKIRPKIKRKVYKPFMRVDVDPSRICNKKAIEELALDIIGLQGNYIMRGFSHGKTKFHCKQVRLCTVDIFETSKGMKAKVEHSGRISRYWFWQGD